MDWVTALPPSGDRSYNACLVIVDRYRKTPIFLPCHKDDTAMDTALLLWSRVLSHTGLFKNIISERDPNISPSNRWASRKNDSTLEDMIRRFCAYGLEFKDSDGFIHDWCTLIPALELAYKKSVHSSTGQTPAIFKVMLDKGKHHAKQSMNGAFEYAKQKWDKSHKVLEFKVGDLAQVSPFNFNNIKGPKKLKYSHVGPFVIAALH
ncbi:hypothetical protein O181_084890 [Austropuccinia psidii MF-1]|uniref:Integrase catalytic domain-containing protein n=1 Tax=Austropuccinia psidii MF-1 TaxID=1389203 RepID=A0A9Q3FR32_9BASI|nr:hypothetical protein [Austropuccinia psidii MF-1]